MLNYQSSVRTKLFKSQANQLLALSKALEKWFFYNIGTKPWKIFQEILIFLEVILKFYFGMKFTKFDLLNSQ